MPRSASARLLLAATASAAAAGPATAADPIVERRGWPQVALADGGDCAAEVRGNGKIFVIAGEGLQPGEEVRFRLTNADIRPLEYRLVADAKGAWSKYYLPFLWGRPGGTVTVSLQGARCTLSLTFDWVRDTGGSEARLGYAL